MESGVEGGASRMRCLPGPMDRQRHEHAPRSKGREWGRGRKKASIKMERHEEKQESGTAVTHQTVSQGQGAMQVTTGQLTGNILIRFFFFFCCAPLSCRAEPSAHNSA